MKYLSLTAIISPLSPHPRNYLDCLLCHHLLEVNTLAFLALVLAVVFSLEHHLIDYHMGKYGISLAITTIYYSLIEKQAKMAETGSYKNCHNRLSFIYDSLNANCTCHILEAYRHRK